jgi:hypothetical protein
MERVRRRLSYANVVATLALVVAVAGIPTAVAVTKSSSKSDVNKKGNIRAGRVTAAKLADGNVTAAKVAGVDIVQVDGVGGFAAASCSSGEQLLGGGARLDSTPPGAAITVSAPNGTTWEASGHGAGVTAYALCLRNAAR